MRPGSRSRICPAARVSVVRLGRSHVVSVVVRAGSSGRGRVLYRVVPVSSSLGSACREASDWARANVVVVRCDPAVLAQLD